MLIDMDELAQEGARVRLEQIKAEADAIRAAFPNLSTNGGGMSAAQRQAVSQRMKEYWAKRRAEKAKKKG
jgi:hypothetical protein